MTNGERYKTAKDKVKGFREFCDKRSCYSCPLKEFKTSEVSCAFRWLALEYKVELMPCPFCGGEALSHKTNYAYTAYCTKCGIKTSDVSSEDEAIAAWNRRVK